MAGNKTLQKFKDSKIPKKGKGKVANEIPIYKEPNTHSEIIGKLNKDQEIKWISKSICDEREWVRMNEDNNFGYVVGYDKDGKCNLEIETIKEKKDKNDKIKENKKLKLVPITKEELNLGNEALKEILSEENKKNDKDIEEQSISTRMEDNHINQSDFSDIDSDNDDSQSSNSYKDEDEKDAKWDNLIFEEDVSKIGSVIKENDKLLNELLSQYEKEQNNNEEKNNKESEKENLVSKALASILDVLPGNENLSKEDRLLNALNLIPGGKNLKNQTRERKDSFGEDIKKSRTLAPKRKKVKNNK